MPQAVRTGGGFVHLIAAAATASAVSATTAVATLALRAAPVALRLAFASRIWPLTRTASEEKIKIEPRSRNGGKNLSLRKEGQNYIKGRAIMSVYVSKRNESKTLFLENARKLSAHTLTYCLKAPKRLTFFLTKDICSLARKVYYEANIANNIVPENKIDAQNRKMHFQQALAACENMELPLTELKSRLELNPQENKEWKEYAFQEWGRLLSEEQRLLKSIMKSDAERFKTI